MYSKYLLNIDKGIFFSPLKAIYLEIYGPCKLDKLSNCNYHMIWQTVDSVLYIVKCFQMLIENKNQDKCI